MFGSIGLWYPTGQVAKVTSEWLRIVFSIVITSYNFVVGYEDTESGTRKVLRRSGSDRFRLPGPNLEGEGVKTSFLCVFRHFVGQRAMFSNRGDLEV
jgi:hypothetical protein